MSYTILIVDDDRIFCEELSETLEEYQTEIATNPQQALALLENPNSVDLVLLDVRLPGMRGTELLKILKERYPEILVIIMTAYASKDVVISSLRNSADNFIEKPLDVGQLQNMIKNLLESKRELKEFARDIDYIKYYLQKNIDKRVEIEDIARIMGYTTKYMSRVFKKKTGMKFNEYRLTLKMDKAKEYLEATDSPIKQIAYQLGYENSESFVRIFKKRTGFTPSQYRKQASR